MSRNTAFIAAVIGASGSGKSAWIKQQLRQGRPARLLVWDPQAEYADFGQVYFDRAALLSDLLAAKKGFRAVYQPGDRPSLYADRFGWLCKLSYGWGECALVVEELADVTRPSWAPDGWSIVCRKGRHRGLRVFGASQRPASVDKDFFGNATLVHCGRLNYEADLRTMGNVLCIAAAELQTLKPMEWIERDMATGATRKGLMRFRTT